MDGSADIIDATNRVRLICTFPNGVTMVLQGVEATRELVENNLINKKTISLLADGFQINTKNGMSYVVEVIQNNG